MQSLAADIGTALAAFTATNIDEIFLLVGFFGDGRYSRAAIFAGQYAGIAVLYGFSALAAMIALVVPVPMIGLLGIVPLVLGVKQLIGREAGSEGQAPDDARTAIPRAAAVSTVTLVTIANGGDNIGVYIPLFATLAFSDVLVIGAVFLVLTGLWCLAAEQLVRHPALGAPIRRYSRRVIPFVFIALGILILLESETFDWLLRSAA